MPPASARVVPRRSKLVGGLRYLRMLLGQLLRGSREPAPVGRPDYYKRELHPSLLIRSAAALPVREFLPPDHREPSVEDLASQCHARFGYFPLNFSFPRGELMPESLEERPHFLSSTIPGEPFSFDDWNDYLAEYRSSYWALSTKKGGWDTFRHLEILFSGAIPLMPGLGRSHPYSLAHFPKRALSSVYSSLVADGPALPGARTREFFRNFARENLTNEAMARYLLRKADAEDATILFLDRSLSQRTDYLSVFTYIGLLRTRGSAVQAAFEPEYVFDDFVGDTHRLYGRGFGYSASVPAALRGSSGLPHDADASQVAALSESFDRIVVGNYDADGALVSELLALGVPETKFVCVVGSDLPADVRLRRDIQRTDMTFFVREFSRA
jgi:hypothetical protein